MSWRNTIKEGGGSWRDTVQEDAPPISNPLEAGVMGVAQGASAGFLDELSGGVEAAGKAVGLKGLGGSFSDIEVDDDGPSIDWEVLRDAYRAGRNRKRDTLSKVREENPGSMMAGEFVGGFVSPANKAVKGMSIGKAGLALGGLNGLGSSESDSVLGMATDTAIGGGLGFGLGKLGEKAAPKIQSGLQSMGKKAAGAADALAYKATGATLKDFRTANAKGQLGKIGRWALDNNIVQAFDDVDDVAARAAAKNQSAGQELDDVYRNAQSQFGEQMNGVGFDPIRDKAKIMSAAERELGQAEGASGALNRLSKYLDEVAARHGDEPLETAMQKYQQDVDAYIPEFKQFLKQRKEYRNSFGSAADDLDQPILPGMVDDLQRTEVGTRSVELNDKPASVMREQPAEYSEQLDLLSLPQRPASQSFNSARGDDLLPYAQQMAMDDNSVQSIINQSKQAGIDGLEGVPRSYGDAPARFTGGAKGQTKMTFAPEAPVRPQRPADIRNPMSPRAANEVKTALDNTINYARNPLAKDPVTERAFSAARKAVAGQVDDSIESLGGNALLDQLKSANRDYGMSKNITQMAQDRVNREGANKLFGLTDYGMIGAGSAATLMTGGAAALPSLAMLGAKKGVEKYGASTAAVGLDRLSKALMKSPDMAKLAADNPKAFSAIVSRIGAHAGPEFSGAMGFPRAAEQNDAAENFRPTDKEQVLNRVRGSKYEQALQNAAQKGDASYNAAFYVLQQRDPDFRKQIGNEN